MPICPQCRGTIAPREAPCGHCGYDFPPPPDRQSQFSLGALLVVTMAVAVGFAMIRAWGIDGVGLAMILGGCVLLALQQSWAMPPINELPLRVLWLALVLLPTVLVATWLGTRGAIVMGILWFTWLFRRNWE
jgi:hypothetical protein